MTTPIRTDFQDGQAPKADAAYLNGLGARINQNSTDIANGPPANKVTTVALQDNSVTKAKIADDAVGAAELAITGTPSAATFLKSDGTTISFAEPPAGGSVGAVDNGDGTITFDGAGVGGGGISDGAVTTAKLAPNAVTKAKLASAAVGWAQLDATGTPSSSTFVKVAADGSLSAATPAGGSGGGVGTVSQLFGDGTTKTFVITHGQGTENVVVQTVIDATGEVFRCDTFIVDDNTVRLEFNETAAAPDVNEGRVIVQGGATSTTVGVTDITGSGATGRSILAATTAPAVQTTLGLKIAAANVLASESTSSSSYTDITTTTDTVTVTVGPSGCMQVSVAAQITHSAANSFAYMSFQLSGANTLAADDTRSIWFKNPAAGGAGFRYGMTHTMTGLAPGVTTVKAKYKSTGGGSATFASRNIGVITL